MDCSCTFQALCVMKEMGLQSVLHTIQNTSFLWQFMEDHLTFIGGWGGGAFPENRFASEILKNNNTLFLTNDHDDIK